LRPTENINDWFRNLNLKRKLACLIGLMAFFLIINGLISFNIGYMRIIPDFGILIIFGISMLVLLLIIPLVLFITENISKPIRILVDKMRQVSAGNLDVEPQDTKYKNEVGELNQSFNTMTDRLRCLVRKESSVSDREKFLREIILSSITTLQSNQVLRTVVVETGKRLGATRCYFIRYDDENKKFLPIQDYEIYISSFQYKDLVGKVIQQVEIEPFSRTLLGQRQELVVNDISKLNLPDTTKHFFDEYEIKSFIATPVVFQAKLIGILMADFGNSVKQLSEDEIHLFCTIANQSAIVVRQTQLFHETQAARDKAEILRRIISNFTGSVNINDTLDNISSEIGRIYNADRVTIAEFPDKGDFSKAIIKSEYTSSLGIAQTAKTELDPAGLMYWGDFIFNKGHVLVIDNILEADMPELLRYNLTILGSSSIIGIPIRKGEDIWGSITIALNQPKHWSEEEISLLPSISGQMYMAIKQAELYSTAKKLADREALLRRITDTIRSRLELSETFQAISEELTRLFNVERVLIVRFPNIHNLKDWHIAFDYTNSLRMVSYKDVQLNPEAGEYWGNFVFNKGVPLAIDNVDESDISESLQYNIKVLGMSAITAIPIRRGFDIWGTLSIATSYPRHWMDDEIQLLTSIADQIYLAINQAELFSTTRKLADRESLLRKITETIRSTLDINDLKKTISTEVGKVLCADRCGIFEFDDKNHKFLKMDEFSQYVSSTEISDYTGIDLEESELHPFRDWLLSGKDFFVPDTSKNTENMHPLMINFYRQERIQSNYTTLLTYRGEMLGFLYLNYIKQKRELAEDDINLLQALSDQAATAVYQSRLLNRANSNAQKEALLRELISTVRNTLDINEIEQGIVNKVGSAFAADRCFFRVYDRNNDKFLPVRVQYLSDSDVSNIIGATFTEKKYGGFKTRYKQGDIHIMPDLEACLLDADCDITGIQALIDDFQVKSNYGFSIFYEDRFLGVFVLHYTEKKVVLDNDSIELLKSVADQAGIALNQAELYATTKRDAERAGAIQRITETIGGSFDINIVMTAICRELIQLFQVDRVATAIYPRSDQPSGWSGTWEVKRLAEYPDFTGKEFSLQSQEWLDEVLIKNKQEIIINNFDESHVPEFFRKEHTQIHTKSNLMVPIKRGDDVLGVIGILTIEEYRTWAQYEIDLMRIIANHAFIAARQAELYINTRISAEREALLRSINNQILTSHNIEEAVQSIVAEVGKIYDVDRVAISFYEPAGKSFSEVKAEYRKNETVPSTFGSPPFTQEVNDYLVSEMIVKRQRMIINSLGETKLPISLRETLKQLNIKSTIITPILYGNTPLGLVFLTCTNNEKQWSQREAELLGDITAQISIGIHLFDLTNKISKSLESERAIRDIIFTARQQENHDLVFNYMLRKLVEIFHVERAVHIHHDEYRNLCVKNEELLDSNFETMCHKPILLAEHTNELEPKTFGETIIVNDIETEIKNAALKEFLKSKKILSFMIYPKAKAFPGYEEEKIGATVMLCSTYPRIWTQNEIDSFKLTVDATSLVYLELKQRSESEETRNTFLATLTHDLRSPINAEQKTLEVILSKRLGTSLEGYAEYLDDMYKTNEELLRIVNNILSVYHYEEGKFELKPEEIDIAELINTSVNVMKPLAHDQGSEIQTEIQPDLPSVIVDRDEILRVMTNLISNAIKHNTKETTINISAKRINNEVQVCIVDNGKGIPEEEKKNIFQRYPTTKRKIGTGLGLYLSKQIIDAHGGKIWFNSEDGKGTAFYFTVPMS
jgi:GAF domain-containing protein/signal transduction histidine kinase